jgi:hypothetical protein
MIVVHLQYSLRYNQMNENKPKTSRRKFIKKVGTGLAASAAISGLGPVTHALQANTDIARERGLIESTIGQATRLLMDSSVKESPDLSAIYRQLGGANSFTTQLLAETFGSRTFGYPGVYRLAPATVPDFTRLSEALATKAKEISSRQSTAQTNEVPYGEPGAPNAAFRIPGITINTGDITINC